MKSDKTALKPGVDMLATKVDRDLLENPFLRLDDSFGVGDFVEEGSVIEEAQVSDP